MRKTVFTFLLSVSILITPLTGFADCPDEAICYISWTFNDPGPSWMPNDVKLEYRELGRIKTPTCWKAAKGCRPWNCTKYQHTNADYWLDRCAEKFHFHRGPQYRMLELGVRFSGPDLLDQPVFQKDYRRREN